MVKIIFFQYYTAGPEMGYKQIKMKVYINFLNIILFSIENVRHYYKE